ncbi:MULTISPECIES: hypothetical protein [Serratia]|jgi:hypothetical protein|uniref:Uncharacterized protein n=1 Tax=Serratia surfactantfaciens TaxID=2741499 RepID=A0ABS0LZU5_9GAMM|nr:hypothetical protein [Serratia surfactantfaciens]MBH1920831.1 hypothetical protein [Serratia surfactantfaciens]MBI6153372.1 hypothetical protein [Serratia surfactantfaciens]WMW59806.1 hypothetical protein RE680_14685 [Serratia marcescens]
MMLRSFFVLSLIVTSNAVMASEDYAVTFKNQTNKTAKIVVVNEICMHSSGKSPMTIPSNASESTSIQDKNSGVGCVNGYKQVFWDVYLNNNKYTQIGFTHQKRGKWVTQITGSGISATCNGIKCSNTGTPGVNAGGPIIITIGG